MIADYTGREIWRLKCRNGNKGINKEIIQSKII